MMGLKAEEMEVLRPGCIEVPKREESDETPWSDHCGLRCTFTDCLNSVKQVLVNMDSCWPVLTPQSQLACFTHVSTISDQPTNQANMRIQR